MPTRALTAPSLKTHLKRCGYDDAQLETDYHFEGGAVPLAAFSGKPFDTRSACINVVEPGENSESSVVDVRQTGAPVVFACCTNRLEWWKQTTGKPEHKETVQTSELNEFFRRHKENFAPYTIYEAKTRRSLPGQTQLHFVDIGLMPMVERRMGDDLSRLIESVLQGMENSLSRPTSSKGHIEAVFKSAFWLLAAKILRDKQVNSFKTIDLSDVDDVFQRVGRHYGDTNGLPPRGKRWRTAIEGAARTVDQFGYLGTVSTEALAYLYENTLVPPQVRKTLGVHSTPSCLVDYMVWQLWPWIEEIDEQDRHVFEPACGHAAFLIGAMRLLRQWSSISDGKQRHSYLKQHLHGVEIDPFALEIAKLSLTLADIPHGNSWDLKQVDMFDKDVLEKAASRCRILLANPPYEKFSPSDRLAYDRQGAPVSAQTKAVEMLMRTIPHLPVGGVFGVVVPQGMLHSSEAAELRGLLVDGFEIAEVALFADNLFEQSDHETAVILGRRESPSASKPAVRYRRVRERDMKAFRERLAFSSEQDVPQSCFTDNRRFDMRVPDLPEVWAYLKPNHTLSTVAQVGQGFSFKGKDLPTGAGTLSATKRRGWIKCFTLARGDWPIYLQPDTEWMNPDPAVIQAPRIGLDRGMQQLLVNHARASRGQWTMKTWIDRDGYAVKGNFLVVRPHGQLPPLEYVWALLNSPLANAYIYTHASKHHIIGSMLERLPLPVASTAGIDAVVDAAKQYLGLSARLSEYMRSQPDEDVIRKALLRMDAEVLKLYDLPPRLERQLLDLFQGVERKGVGCDFRGYYPDGLDAYVPLHELISEEYQRSTLDAFLERHQPTESPEVLAALRAAVEVYAEE